MVCTFKDTWNKHNGGNLKMATYIPPSTTRERMHISRPACSRFTASLVNTTLRPLQPTLLNKMMEGRENSWRAIRESVNHWYSCPYPKFTNMFFKILFDLHTYTVLTCPVVCMERMIESEDRKPMATVLGYSPSSSTYMLSLNWAPSYATQLTNKDTHTNTHTHFCCE